MILGGIATPASAAPRRGLAGSDSRCRQATRNSSRLQFSARARPAASRRLRAFSARVKKVTSAAGSRAWLVLGG
jgi:hypothetical protein